ncbi:MAG: pyridoxamine 5'-phosphate oxidase family protein [Acidimicrobiales bacterium]
MTKSVTKRSFLTLGTASATNRPHVTGVLYEVVDGALYVNTLRTSKKARNIADNPHVSVLVPVRRLPVGPPSSVQFQATAEVLPYDHPDIVRLLDAGHLKSITKHGELDLPAGCFLRITPPRRLNTYGLGMPLRQLLRDPLHAAGSVEVR